MFRFKVKDFDIVQWWKFQYSFDWIEIETDWYFGGDEETVYHMITNKDINCISPGTRVRLIQDNVYKFFIACADKYDYKENKKTVTLFGGKYYILTNTPFFNVCYSVSKTPYGFPIHPNNWVVDISRK